LLNQQKVILAKKQGAVEIKKAGNATTFPAKTNLTTFNF
jgi:hypothetical protein